jgi:hypothetical protein
LNDKFKCQSKREVRTTAGAAPLTTDEVTLKDSDMSQPTSFGPFRSPEAKPAEGAGLGQWPTQLEYIRSYNFLFENPNWMMNLLWMFLCQLAGQAIPLLPAMVMYGYQFEVLDSLLASRGSRHVDFDPNKLGDYLGRGVWPVIVLLIFALASSMFFGIIVFVFMFGGAAAAEAGGEAGIVIFIGALLIVMLVGIVLASVVSIFSTPMILRAGMTQQMGEAFNFAWVNDFVRKMWLETILSTLFVTCSVLGLLLVTCFLAGIILGPVLPFVSMHLMYQLYAIYLGRGGMPIPAKLQPGMP